MRKKKLSHLVSHSILHENIEGSEKIFEGAGEEAHFGRDAYSPVNPSRINFLRAIVLVVFLLVISRLFWLSVIKGEENRALAEGNRVKLVNIEALRGEILDRNNNILVESKRRYFLENDEERVEISFEQVKTLEEEGLAGRDFSGDLGKISEDVFRDYKYSEVTSHITGYISKVAEEDLKDDTSLKLDDFIGRGGVEGTYDNILKGDDGKKIIEVDSLGKPISVLGEQEPVSGRNITLTINKNLQQKSFEVISKALKEPDLEAGAIIISDPKSGEILSLVSFPGYDPSNVAEYTKRKDLPLFNRVISGTYPPGSVFKIVSAFAGLASGEISKDTEIEDVGQFTLGGQVFSNWYFTSYGGKDGTIKIDKAIARSNDIFFYRLGEETGLSNIRNWALKFGYGKKTGVDLPGETFGLVPDELWKETNYGDSWYLGDTMHLAIGQGFLLATPIQVNMMTSYIASGGEISKPHLVMKVVSTSGEDLISGSSKDENVAIEEEYLSIVRDGMRQACTEGGTGWPFFDASYSVGCKTGTAERLEGNPHAWFTAYAPYDDPAVAITVLIENGGEGSTVAGPIAREILDWYFEETRVVP